MTQNKLLNWPELAAKLPLLAAALPNVGHFQTRNKGTVCGSIAHADPSSEIPLSLAVLDGEVVLRSARGTRVLAAADFQQRHAVHRLRARRADHRGALSGRALARRGVPRSGAPPRRLRHHRGRGDGGRTRRRYGSASAAWRASRRCGASRPMAAPRMRSSKLASELEGYEDLHASAAMRRDILRHLAPVVIAEAQKCAA